MGRSCDVVEFGDGSSYCKLCERAADKGEDLGEDCPDREAHVSDLEAHVAANRRVATEKS